MDLLDLAAEHATPLFVYDEEQLRARCREAVSAWGPMVAYGSKAFLCKAMALLVHEEGMCIDVSTGGELHVALAAGVPADRLVMHGNNKSDAEIARAVEVGVGRIVVDSFDEIERLLRVAATADRPPRVMVRVTPGVEAHTHEYVTTGVQDTKFGFSLAGGLAADAVKRLAESKDVELVGIHAHIGSQVFRLDSFAREVEALAPFVKESGLPELCIGGGLGVAYVEGEMTPSITEWASTVQDACAAYGISEDVSLSAEPGRSIVAAAAITLYTIGTVKEVPGARTYVSVDGGMSDNPRPVLYGSGYEAFLPRATDAERDKLVTIVGKHCETGDFVVRGGRVPQDLEVGDILATPVTGAYGHSMASNYNKVPRAPVIFVRDGTSRVVVRRETLDDLLRLEGD